MDQDFHYYGTYFAARTADYDPSDAAMIARASNFIDFLHERDYGGPWRLVAGDQEIARLAHPRFTFQNGKLHTGLWPEDGLWCSFHFTPGNYDHIDAPTSEQLHGAAVADRLPGFEVRPTPEHVAESTMRMLNRPQSALARALLADGIECGTNIDRLGQILQHAVGGDWLLANDTDDVLRRFRLMLAGIRAHVISDTWAHQDFAGLDNAVNTYFDIRNEFGRQAIEYRDVSDDWHHTVLAALRHENLQAVPNGTSYLGHGWMGRFPDYSFASFRYKPFWRPRGADPFERENPSQYRAAFLEVCSLLAQVNGEHFDPEAHAEPLAAADRAISAGCVVADASVKPRVFSASRWRHELALLFGEPAPGDIIDAEVEPHPNATFDGVRARPGFVTSITRRGTYTVGIDSDLYLFQIAADYHFRFVQHWLARHDLYRFEGAWSQLEGPLRPQVDALF